jgi:hypothetical protein
MKKRNAIVAVLVVIFVLFGVYAIQTNLIDLRNFNLEALLDDGTMRLIIIVLVCVTAMQSVGLYLLSKRPPVSQIQVDPLVEREQRGRGRPRKPCQLALAGVLLCPLEPSLDLDPDYVARISDAVAHYQHEKLTGKPESKPNLKEPEDMESPEQKVPPATKEQEGKPEDKEKGEKESVGALMVDILDKKTQKEKDEKKK